MTKPNIVFFDPVCPKPYQYVDLSFGGMGGTEASCLRIAKGLSSKGYPVNILQRGRQTILQELDLGYFPFNAEITNPNVIITLRDAGSYVKNIQSYPDSIHYLWMHDVVNGDYKEHLLAHFMPFDRPINMVCVSDWHKQQILQALASIKHKIAIKRIYGPIPDYCTHSNIQYDPYKLIFTSSPHKGLDHTLEIFKELYKRDSRYKLYVSNPGYFADKQDLPEGVINLGSISHKDLIEHVRTSLCLFYPNTTFAETFGLVMAEAEAVGTPCIVHNIGAVPEVVTHRKSILNCNDSSVIIDTVIRWSNGERLIVNGNALFKLDRVIKEWERLWQK